MPSLFARPHALLATLLLVASACSEPPEVTSAPRLAADRQAVMSDFLHETFEGGLGSWQVQTTSGNGAWHVLTNPETIAVSSALNPFSVTLADSGAHLPALFGTHVAWFGNDDTGTFIGSGYPTQTAKNGGSSSAAQAGTLTSPAFTLTGVTKAQLEFESWWEIEGTAAASYDLMQVWVSKDGAAFVKLGQLNPSFAAQQPAEAAYSSGGPAAAPVWRHYVFDLSSYVGSSVRVQFKFDSRDPSYNAFRGFTVDEVIVRGGDAFAAPTLSGVSPGAGTANDLITISGDGFLQGAKFYIGTTEIPASAVTQFGSKQMIFKLPTLTAGTYDVKVLNVDGQQAVLTSAFTYTSAVSPSVQQISPASSSLNVPVGVTITGANFAAGASVTIGTVVATDVVVVNSSQITATVPGLPAGTYNVTVANPTGQSGTLYAAFNVADLPFLSLSAPAGGEQWSAATTQTITWTSSGASSVGLELYKAGAWVATIASNLAAADGAYSWALPASLAGGTDYKVRIFDSAASLSAFSASTFEIVPVPVPTTTTVVSAKNPSAEGAPVAFTATVTPTPSGGSVQFTVDGAALGAPVMIFGGTATSIAASNLSAGVHAVSASFSGDGAYVASSGSLSQTVNHAPVATAQQLSGNEDTNVSLVLSGTDADGDALGYAIETFPAHGQLNGTLPNLVYTPNANWHGTDTFSFRVNDGIQSSAPATIAIAVASVNDAPVASSNTVSGSEDSNLTVTLVASDVDGDTLSYAVTAPAHGTLTGTAPNLVYVPNANFFGTDSFRFQASDAVAASNVATITVNVTSVNDAPVAQGQSVSATEDVPVGIALTATDVEGDALSYQLVSPPAHGTLSGTPPNVVYTPASNYNGPDGFTFVAKDASSTSNVASVQLSIAAVNDAPIANAGSTGTDEDAPVAVTLSGSDVEQSALTFTVVTAPTHGTLSGTAPNLTYTPDADFHGEDSLSFQVRDGELDSAVATVSLDVASINDAPVAQSQSTEVLEDQPTAMALEASDVDGDPLAFTVTAAPAHGTLSGEAPALTYTPDANYHGPDSFSFRVHDGTVDSPVATISIDVVQVNDAPVANGAALQTDEDTALAIALSGTDVEEDALTYAVVELPAHGSLTGSPPAVTYTPATDFHGEDRFTFKANDGQADSAVETVVIAVQSVNDAPVASALAKSTLEDTEVAITLAGTDVDGDEVTFELVAAPAHGTLSGTPPELTYVPARDYLGQDSFSFRVNDGALDSAPAEVTLSIGGVNDAPVSEGESFTTDEDVAIAVPLRAVDVDGDVLAYRVVTPPAHGTLTGEGAALTYHAEANYHGADQFSFRANDGQADSELATVSLEVASVDDRPVAVEQALSLIEDLASDVKLHGTDVEGAALSYAVVSAPAHGKLSGEAPNLVYQSEPDYAGSDAFTFTVTADGVESAPATVAIEIAAMKDELSGGGMGCSTTGEGALSSLWLVLAALLVPQLKRVRVAKLAAAALALGLPFTAGAQSALPTIEVEALRLNPGAADGLVSEAGLLLEPGMFRVGLSGHYEYEPLIYSRNGERIGAVLQDRTTTHLNLAWAPTGWLELGAQLPLVLSQHGDDLSLYGLGQPSSAAVATPVFQARYSPWQQRSGDAFDLAFQLAASLPVANGLSLASEAGFGVMPEVSAGRRLTSWLRVGGEVGLVIRPSAQFDGASLGRNAVEGAVVLHTIGSGLRGELTYRASMPLDGGRASSELLAGVRQPFLGRFEVYGVGGVGLGRAPGTPAFRMLAGLSMAFGTAAKQPAPMLAAPKAEAPVALAAVTPPPDADHDGVLDDADRCPAEAGGADRGGCPVRDADRDGIEDDADRCVSAAGTVEHAGCPAPFTAEQLAELNAQLLAELRRERMFTLGQRDLNDTSRAALDRVVSVLLAHPELGKVRVEGHTDSVGTTTANLALSKERAELVGAYLIQKGIAPERIETVGAGSSKPVAPNRIDGNEVNRRVEIVLLGS